MNSYRLSLLNIKNVNMRASELETIKQNIGRQYINSPRKPLVTYVKKRESRIQERKEEKEAGSKVGKQMSRNKGRG